MVRPDDDSTVAPPAQAASDLSLLVVSDDTAQSYRLPSRGEITVGRGEGVSLRIREPWISRRHAALHVAETLSVEDLGSANGTRVRDVRLVPGERVVVTVGEVIELGSTTLVVTRTRAGMPPRRVRSKSHFDERLAEECASSGKNQLGFAVVRVSVESAFHEPAHVALLCATRASDLLTIESPGKFTVLLSRTTRLEADAVVDKIGHLLHARGVRVTIGNASGTGGVEEPHALLAAASAGARPWSPARGDLAGASAPKGERMLQVHALLARIAAGQGHVLLLGETGAGKGALARRIHALSPRAAAPFLAIDCAALAEDVVVHELFRGAQGGMLQAARGATLFLEEVGALSLPVQDMLLREIDEPSHTARIIASTARHLPEEVLRGTFREALLARLKGAELSVPPLRDRGSDLEELAREFIARACRSAGRETPPELTNEALALLLRYSWPGNVRELRNVIARAVVTATGHVIGPEHLPREKLEATVPAPGTHLRTELEEIERKRILSILERCGGNQSRTAKLLGISRNTLIARLNAYGVERPRGGGR